LLEWAAGIGGVDDEGVGLADADLEIDAAGGGEADEVDAVGEVLLEKETDSGRNELVGDVRDDGEIVDLGEFLEGRAVIGKGNGATEHAESLERLASQGAVGIRREADAVVVVPQGEADRGCAMGLDEEVGSERMVAHWLFSLMAE
jgi:hypothetical protein